MFTLLNMNFINIFFDCWQLSLEKDLQSNSYNLGLISFCTSVSVCFLLWCFWCPSPCPPLPLFVMRLGVIPLIVVVSPSPCLHSRSRPSANSSSSSSWLPLGVQDQDHLLCCWAPGPQPLQPRAREGWSNQASSESAVVQTRWLVFHSGQPSLFLKNSLIIIFHTFNSKSKFNLNVVTKYKTSNAEFCHK